MTLSNCSFSTITDDICKGNSKKTKSKKTKTKQNKTKKNKNKTNLTPVLAKTNFCLTLGIDVIHDENGTAIVS